MKIDWYLFIKGLFVGGILGIIIHSYIIKEYNEYNEGVMYGIKIMTYNKE